MSGCMGRHWRAMRNELRCTSCWPTVSAAASHHNRPNPTWSRHCAYLDRLTDSTLPISPLFSCRRSTCCSRYTPTPPRHHPHHMAWTLSSSPRKRFLCYPPEIITLQHLIPRSPMMMTVKPKESALPESRIVYRWTPHDWHTGTTC